MTSHDIIECITAEIREMAELQQSGILDEGEVLLKLEEFAQRLQATGLDGDEIKRVLQDKLIPGLFDTATGENTEERRDFVIDTSNLTNPHLESSIYHIYGPPIPGLSIQCGDMVQRSAHWQRGNDDGGPGQRGLVHKVTTEHAYVTWKNQNASKYRFSDLERVGRARNIHLGDTVVRGPDWKHGDQDGGTRGVVTKFASEGREVYVLWQNQRQANYRWGYAYDLRVVKSLYGIDVQGDEGPVHAGAGLAAKNDRSEFNQQTFNNNSSCVWGTGDFVLRGPFWREGNMADGGEGMYGVVQGSDPQGKVSVRWQATGKVDTYHPDDLALVLPICVEKTVRFKHRMHRVDEAPASATAATFRCKYCALPLAPINAARPPFYCPDCRSGICMACYHLKKPPQVYIAGSRQLSLVDCRKIYTAYTGASFFDGMVNTYLEMFDANLQLAIEDYRANPPDLEARQRIPLLPPPRVKSASPMRSPSQPQLPQSVYQSQSSTPKPKPAQPPSNPFSTHAAASSLSDTDDDPNDSETQGMLLMALVLGGNLKELRRLIEEQGVDPNAVGINGRSALHTAAGHACKKNIVEYLVSLPLVDVNLGDFSGDTPLAHAVEEADLPIIEVLLTRPDITLHWNFNGFNPLHRAARIKNPEVSRAVTALLLLHPAGHTAVNDVDTNKMSPLHLAVALDSHHETARLLCDAGTDLFLMTVQNFHPLSEAVYRGSTECVKVLLSYRVGHPQTGLPQTDIVDESGLSPLHIAASFDRADIVHLLIDAGANMEHRCNKQLTPLHKSVRKTVSNNNKEGKFSTNSALALIDRGVDVYAPDKEMDSALHVACMGGLAPVVRRLCEHYQRDDVSVDAKNLKGLTPMHLACAGTSSGTGSMDNQLAVISTLKSFGADLESTDVDEETPLCIACGHSSSAIVALLLELGADPNVRSACKMQRKNSNRTPLMTAALNGKSDIVALLLDHGASPLEQDSDGDDSVQYAIGGKDEHHDCIRILLTAPDASPFMGNNKGSTALHRAASKNFLISLTMFLDHATAAIDPSCIDVQDASGDTALHDAVNRSQYDCVKFLVERGASVNIVNWVGKSALEAATRQGDERILPILKDAPALSAAFLSRRQAEQAERLQRQQLDASDIVLEFRTMGVNNHAFEKRLYELFPSLEALQKTIALLPTKMREELPEKLFREGFHSKGVAFELLEGMSVISGFVRIIAKLSSALALSPPDSVQEKPRALPAPSQTDFLDPHQDALRANLVPAPPAQPDAQPAADKSPTLSGTTNSSSEWLMQFTIPWEEIRMLDGQAKIGQGSFGIVFKAAWKRKGRQPTDVAVKVVSRSSAMSKGLPFDKAVDQMRNEFETLLGAWQKVTNKECIVLVRAIAEGKPHKAMVDALPGIVHENEDAVGIVMRFEGGGSLNNLLYPTDPTKVQRLLSSQDKLSILKQIASGIEELHALNIVHGDLKPENILLSSVWPPLVRIADFGLAKQREELALSSTSCGMTLTTSCGMTPASHFAGTKLYAAPEMFPSEDDPSTAYSATRKTDIYAFALIMWEVLVRKRPFDSILKTGGMWAEMRLVQAVLRGDRPDISEIDALDRVCRSELKALISSCWSNERASRLTAYACFEILEQCHARSSNLAFDIFFSYNWSQKKIGLHLVKMLTEAGYRVWIDRKDMSHDMTQAMVSGITAATVFLCLISREYQSSKNCMFELDNAKSMGKPIITLVAQPKPFDWASPALLEAASLSTHLFVDISSIAADDVWKEASNDALPSASVNGLLKDVIEETVIDLLDHNSCRPSMRLERSSFTSSSETRS